MGPLVSRGNALILPPVRAVRAGQSALKADPSATNATESVNDLLLQIRELTNTNLES